MNWVQRWLEATACPSLEPQRDRQVESLAHEIGRAMRQEGRFFHLEQAAAALGIPAEDLPLVRERLYELSLKFALRRFTFADKDRAALGWVARKLQLAPEQARQVELRVGRKVFEEYLAFAIAGGFLDDEERAQLRAIATCLAVTTRQLVLGYLVESGGDFLHRIMEGMADAGRIPDAAWEQLLSNVETLGVSRVEFMAPLRGHAAGFARKIINRAKANGGLTRNQIPPMRSLVDKVMSVAQRGSALRPPAGTATRVPRPPATA